MGTLFTAVGNGASVCLCTYPCAYYRCTHVKTLVQWAIHRYISKYHFGGRSVFNTIYTHTRFKKEKLKVVNSRVHELGMPVIDGGLAEQFGFSLCLHHPTGFP